MSPLVQCHQWKLLLHQQDDPDLDPAAPTSRTWLKKGGKVENLMLHLKTIIIPYQSRNSNFDRESFFNDFSIKKQGNHTRRKITYWAGIYH